METKISRVSEDDLYLLIIQLCKSLQLKIIPQLNGVSVCENAQNLILNFYYEIGTDERISGENSIEIINDLLDCPEIYLNFNWDFDFLKWNFINNKEPNILNKNEFFIYLNKIEIETPQYIFSKFLINKKYDLEFDYLLFNQLLLGLVNNKIRKIVLSEFDTKKTLKIFNVGLSLEEMDQIKQKLSERILNYNIKSDLQITFEYNIEPLVNHKRLGKNEIPIFLIF